MGDASDACTATRVVVTGLGRINRGFCGCGMGGCGAPSCDGPRLTTSKASSRAGAEIVLFMGHDDFHTALTRIQSLFGLTAVPDCATMRRHLVAGDDVYAQIARWSCAAHVQWAKMKSRRERRLVAAAKACLIAADVAGSALPKALPDDPNRWRWITVSFAATAQPGDFAAVVRHRLRGESPRVSRRRWPRASVSWYS